MATSDLRQLLGFISQEQNQRNRAKRKHFKANYEEYERTGTSGSDKWDRERHVRDARREAAAARKKAAEKNSKAQKDSPGHSKLVANPQLQAGYQPGTLKGIIRPVGAFDMPGPNGDYGPRDHPVHGGYSNHTGLDMSESAGTNIYAAASGIVDSAKRDSVYGNQVVLYHGSNKEGIKYDTMYGHMQTLLVHPGQKVAQGDLIGYVGETGLTTGNHLHFETWESKNPVNPLKYLTEYDKQDLKKRVAPQPNVEARSGRPNRRLEAFLDAISEQESGGDSNYQAVGVPTKYGTAYGKYQILDSNIRGTGGWDQEYLGQNISIEDFLHDPTYQERIARGKLSDYYNQYGPEGAAKAWYGGPGVANTNSDRPQYGGPSINDYASSVLEKMLRRL